MNALKVLLLADYGAMGGTRTYFKQLLALYAEQNVALWVLRTYADEEVDRICQLHGFQCFNVSDIAPELVTSGMRMPARMAHERKVLRQFVESVDADIAVASVGTPELFMGALSLTRRGLYILHTYPTVASTWPRAIAKRVAYSYVIPKQVRIVTVSEFSKALIGDVWGLGQGVRAPVVVPSTVGEIVLHHSHPHPSAQTILTIGHVEDYKNPAGWIQIATTLMQARPDDNLRFVWVGEGSRLSACQAQVASLPFSRQIRFVGRDDLIAKYYEQSMLYLQPSRVENMALSVLDAMRYGLPCIVAKTGGLPEAVMHGTTGWVVDVDDISGFASRLDQLLNDATLRKKMGMNGQNRYLEHFSRARWAEAMWALHC